MLSDLLVEGHHPVSTGLSDPRAMLIKFHFLKAESFEHNA